MTFHTLFRLPSFATCGTVDLWNDGPEGWYADRECAEDAIRDANPGATDEELATMYATLQEFTPSADQHSRFIAYTKRA